MILMEPGWKQRTVQMIRRVPKFANSSYALTGIMLMIGECLYLVSMARLY